MASEYSKFTKLEEQTEEGEYVGWRNINALPDEENRRRVVQVIKDDAAAYKRLGYLVELEWLTADSVNLRVKHKRKPNHSDVALLAGAIAATKARAGWGGSG